MEGETGTEGANQSIIERSHKANMAAVTRTGTCKATPELRKFLHELAFSVIRKQCKEGNCHFPGISKRERDERGKIDGRLL